MIIVPNDGTLFLTLNGSVIKHVIEMAVTPQL